MTGSGHFLSAALRYASRGWPVFPLAPGRKIPACQNGKDDATTDAAKIASWWALNPNANIGLLTGVAFDVLDLDVKPELGTDGVALFSEMCREHPDFDPRSIPRARTGKGGRHLLFRPTGQGNRAKIRPGIDFRGKGGYIVAPPSVTESTYEWIREVDGDPPEAPVWLLALFDRPRQERPVEASAPVGAYGKRALESAVAAVCGATEGDRNHTLFRQAAGVFELAAGGELDFASATYALRNAGLGVGLADREVERTLESAQRAGSSHPRSAPRLRPEVNSTAPRPSLRVVPDAATDGRPDGITLYDEVGMEPINWLWYGRIAVGKLTVIDGDPDAGKGHLTMDIASKVSTGSPWPDGSPCARGGVVILSAEDGLRDTLVPRLTAAGGDRGRVADIGLIGDDKHVPAIPADLPTIEAACRLVDARVLIVDPIMAYLGEEVNGNSDQSVRRALAHLAKVAERTGIAVIAVRHLNKSGGANPLYRGGGSIAFTAAARVAMIVGLDPDDPSRRILARIKGNVARPVPSMAYHIEEYILHESANPPDRQRIVTSRLVWDGDSELTAKDLLATTSTEGEGSVNRTEAEEFLRSLLAAGPVSAKEVSRQAEESGIAIRALRSAKERMGVVSRRAGFGTSGAWSWALPPEVEDHSAVVSTHDPDHRCTIGAIGAASPDTRAYGAYGGEGVIYGEEHASPDDVNPLLDELRRRHVRLSVTPGGRLDLAGGDLDPALLDLVQWCEGELIAALRAG
jgi:Bifunctional DNA primase/polymerase, N-terminal/AAA domain